MEASRDDDARPAAAEPGPSAVDVRVLTGISREDPSGTDLTRLLMDRRLRYVATMRLPRAIAPADLTPDGFEIVRFVAVGSRTLQLERPSGDALVRIEALQRSTQISIATAEEGDLEKVWTEMAELARPHIVDSSSPVPCSMWVGGRGITSRPGLVSPSTWDQVRRNYPTATARSLDPVMRLEGPPRRGRLLLWHGPPGTGKTSAATALMAQWLPWCDAHVITDPEAFFDDPHYLLEVAESRGTEAFDSSPPSPRTLPENRWKVIVCEDADEYLRTDARQRSGPALGRLLNLSDGIMGRDIRCLVLLTTNDDIATLHPALTRPGRCLSTVSFPSLSADEAAAWCPPGVTPPGGRATIAELFALADGAEIPQSRSDVGLYL